MSVFPSSGISTRRRLPQQGILLKMSKKACQIIPTAIYLQYKHMRGDILFYFLLIVIGYIGYIFGAFAFSQIVGSIRARAHFFTIVFWSILTVVLCGLVYLYLTKYLLALAIGLIISLIMVLCTPKIE